MGPLRNSTVKLPQPEQLIGEKYRLLQRLGQGGMGYVFLAEKLHLGTKVRAGVHGDAKLNSAQKATLVSGMRELYATDPPAGIKRGGEGD